MAHLHRGRSEGMLLRYTSRVERQDYLRQRLAKGVRQLIAGIGEIDLCHRNNRKLAATITTKVRATTPTRTAAARVTRTATAATAAAAAAAAAAARATTVTNQREPGCRRRQDMG